VKSIVRSFGSPNSGKLEMIISAEIKITFLMNLPHITVCPQFIHQTEFLVKKEGFIKKVANPES
jgi:hypothetical protein